MQQVIIHIIIVVLMFAALMIATAQKTDSRGVRQQIVERQTALLIEAAEPGMVFSLPRFFLSGSIDSMKIENGRILVTLDGFPSLEGYPFFTPYNVRLKANELNYEIIIEDGA